MPVCLYLLTHCIILHHNGSAFSSGSVYKLWSQNPFSAVIYTDNKVQYPKHNTLTGESTGTVIVSQCGFEDAQHKLEVVQKFAQCDEMYAHDEIRKRHLDDEMQILQHGSKKMMLLH